jgi:dienelactone hydrolase
MMMISKMIAAIVLTFAISGSLFAQGKAPVWLDEVQTPPVAFAGTANSDATNDWLVDTNGEQITTIAQWEKRRDEYREAWIKHLGLMASVRKQGVQYNPPAIEVLEEVEIDNLIRRKILYETEPGQKVRAYLMMPKTIESPRPAIVVFHGTNKYSYHQTAGVYEVNVRASGYHLAKKGYVTICPQCSIWPCSDDVQIAYQAVTKQFRQRNPDQWGMARMILDAQIAVDILVSMKEVDPTRIGCTGHSLGGKQSLYLPAFDERVYCSVSSEGGVGIEQSNWEADWYLGPDSKKSGFTLNHREIVAMIAPRPFLLIGGNASDGDASWSYIASAMTVYRLYGEPVCIGLYNHQQGHSMPPDAEIKTYEWFDAFLVP